MTKLIVGFPNFTNDSTESKPAGVSFLCKTRKISVKLDRRSISRAEKSKLLQATFPAFITDKMICNLDRKSRCSNWLGSFLHKRRENKLGQTTEGPKIRATRHRIFFFYFISRTVHLRIILIGNQFDEQLYK